MCDNLLQESFLGKIGQTLCRIEDFSFILVWLHFDDVNQLIAETERDTGKGKGKENNLFSIALVELPKLNLSFEPQVVSMVTNDYKLEREIRLKCRDLSGYYISEIQDPAINSLLVDLPHSLLVQSDKQGFAAVVCTTPYSLLVTPYSYHYYFCYCFCYCHCYCHCYCYH